MIFSIMLMEVVNVGFLGHSNLRQHFQYSLFSAMFTIGFFFFKIPFIKLSSFLFFGSLGIALMNECRILLNALSASY